MKVERVAATVEPLRTNRGGKRFFSEAYKRTIVDKCLVPGASVSAVALSHGFNANLVRKWIAKHQAERAAPSTAPKLIPVRVSEATRGTQLAIETNAPASEKPSDSANGSIEIDLGMARLVLRGTVAPEQLRVVIDALVRRR